MDAQLAAAGKSVGIEFRYDLQTHTPNTFDSHRLVWLAGIALFLVPLLLVLQTVNIVHRGLF
jgi:predicted DsbA family dithiol-disulfide isomerase